MKYLISLFLLSGLIASATDAFPTSLRGGLPGNMWTNVGPQLGYGIPNRSSVFATYTTSDSLSTINSGIASCPSNQVVVLSAGSYDMGGGTLQISNDGVTVRGETNSTTGLPTTFLTNCRMAIGGDFGPGENWGTSGTAIGVSSGLTEGSTSITLSSSPGSDFAAGQVFLIDQLFDGTNVTDSSTDSLHRPNRAYCFVAYITSISGTMINFQPPLLGEFWDSGQTPQAYGWASSGSIPSTVRLSGFENIDLTAGTYPNDKVTILGQNYGCWLKNCRITGWGLNEYGNRMMFAVSDAIKDCVFHDAVTSPNSSYAIYLTAVSYAAIEYNCFTNVGIAMPTVAAVGCSVSYNAGLPPLPYSPSTWLVEYFFPHGGHCHHNLYEGNWLPSPIYFDEVYGSNNSDNGIVRNRLQGWSSGKTSDLYPIAMDSHNRNTVILGNILGMVGVHSVYPDDLVLDGTDNTGTIMTNNWNVVSAGIPSGESLGSNTMLDSYRFTSKPSDFGVLPFPPFPVTAATTYTNTTSYTNILPGYRAYFGQFPPAESSSAPQAPGRLRGLIPGLIGP